MDWTKTGYAYDVVVNVVHQTDVNNVLGLLSGVQLEGMTVSENYYSDSRIQAKLTTIVPEGESDGYIKHARLRINMSIPSRFWSEDLITGYVSDVDVDVESGYTKRIYTIEGTLWGLLEHKIKAPITISKGSNLVSVWKSLMADQTRMQYSTEGSQDHTFSSTVVYEAGSNLSTVLFEMSSGYDRIDSDGHGVVTLKKYIAPSNQEPSRTLDYKDDSGLLLSPIKANDTSYEAPGRAVVTATVSQDDPNNEGKMIQKVIVGSYDAPDSHQTSLATRGWLRGRSDSYSGNSETPTTDELNTIAKQNWEAEQSKGVEWTVSSVFADYHVGEVLMLVVPYNFGESKASYNHKVLISSVQTNLSTLVQNLTMKEVG